MKKVLFVLALIIGVTAYGSNKPPKCRIQKAELMMTENGEIKTELVDICM